MTKILCRRNLLALVLFLVHIPFSVYQILAYPDGGFFLSKICVYLSKCIPDMFTRGLIMLGPSLFKHFFDQHSCVLRNPNQTLSDVIHCDTIVGRVDSQTGNQNISVTS